MSDKYGPRPALAAYQTNPDPTVRRYITSGASNLPIPFNEEVAQYIHDGQLDWQLNLCQMAAWLQIHGQVKSGVKNELMQRIKTYVQVYTLRQVGDQLYSGYEPMAPEAVDYSRVRHSRSRSVMKHGYASLGAGEDVVDGPGTSSPSLATDLVTAMGQTTIGATGMEEVTEEDAATENNTGPGITFNRNIFEDDGYSRPRFPVLPPVLDTEDSAQHVSREDEIDPVITSDRIILEDDGYSRPLSPDLSLVSHAEESTQSASRSHRDEHQEDRSHVAKRD